MRFRISTFILFLCLLISSTYGQENKDDIVLAKFDDQKITIGEFKDAYKKMGAGSGYAENDSISYLNNFMKLYMKSRLKLKYAMDIDLENEPSVKNKIQNFKDELIYNYFVKKYVTESRLHKIFDRRKWELRLSHILFVPQKGSEDETLKQAQAVLNKLKNGADFGVMAERYSQDPNSKYDSGDIYYFTSGILPIAIEDAIYNTKVGDIYPHVVKSKFGYQIFKVTEKKERRNKIRGKQLLIKYEFDGKPDTARALAIIDTVYQKLNAGANFDTLISKYSMDENVDKNQGDLGYVSRNMLIRPFDQALFKLNKVGEFSGIIKSPYGFHIIQLTSVAPEPTFLQDLKEINQLFEKNQFDEALEMTIDSLKKDNNFALNKEVQKEIDTRIDTSKNGFDINALPQSIKDKTIFSYTGRTVTVGNLIEIIQNLRYDVNKEITGLSFNEGVNRISGRLLILKDGNQYEDKIPNYYDLVSDFTNKILVPSVEKKEVTDKVIEDSVNLHKYYNENKNKYMWPDRVEFTEIYSTSEPVIKKYQKMIKNGANFDSLCAKYTERPGYKKLAGHWSLRDKNFTEMHKKAWTIKNIGNYSDIYPNFKGYSIIRLDNKVKSKTKTFEEALPDLKEDYNNSELLRLESKFLDMLNNKYNPIIYYDKLAEVKN
ncbi:MAG TPA: peptidylprolyl isomerase [Ignavibacteriaceae bacterium]|nr:peptidylprolyl isomerase [Ignavibacteriaceae bacterium]